MARKVRSRTVINRRALDAVTSGWVFGFEDLAKFTLESTRPPDAPPIGQGLVTSGDWVIYAKGKKVAGTGKKPRGLKVRREYVVMALGWGFPARFNEAGTIRQPARPFATPPWMSMTQRMANTLRVYVTARLRRFR